MNGVIALYKERGMTSHDCVSRLRRILHTKKVGHTGTLDPNVDGVLPICIGSATKLSNLLMESGKKYRGSITIGFATETEDLYGKTIEQKALLEPLTDDQITATLAQLTGEIQQIPPMYSAVKVNGRKLYEYAREGIEIERAPRTVNIQKFVQTMPSYYDEANQTQTIYFEVWCSKGTYVRTLAVDFGKLIGMPSVMSNLTRIKSGGFEIEQTSSLAEVEAAMVNEQPDSVIHSLEETLQDYFRVDLTDPEFNYVSDGRFLRFDRISDIQKHAVVALYHQGKVKALYELDNQINQYRPYKMFLN